MDFITLQETIPLARYGKEKVLEMKPYPNITLAMPGRHAEDTTPKGGDFVVMIDDNGLKWRKHQFKHDSIFNDVEEKTTLRQTDGAWVMERYLDIVAVGVDPAQFNAPRDFAGIQVKTFLTAIQCLAVAEHRRYSQYEAKFGGRFLPFRFAAGIAEGLWTAQDAIDVQRYGRPAVEKLEKKNGVPALSQKLMN